MKILFYSIHSVAIKNPIVSIVTIGYAIFVCMVPVFQYSSSFLKRIFCLEKMKTICIVKKRFHKIEIIKIKSFAKY